MNILMMGHHYWPEDVSGSALAAELAEDLVRHGHQVTFITSAPSYPYGKVFVGHRNGFCSQEERNGVRIIRTWSYISPRKSFLHKLLNQCTFSLSAFWGGPFTKKPDLIVSFSPPLPLGLSAWAWSRIWKVPWLLRVEDLYPDTAISSGVIRNKFAIRILLALEKFLYQQATHISVISNGFKSIIQAKEIPEKKLTVLPVWADAEKIVPLKKENSFRKKHNLQGKFVLLYAGNLGQTSSLDEVIIAANMLKSYSDIHFLVVGEGNKKESLQLHAKELALGNIDFLPYQPREDYPEMLASADIGLVTINDVSAKYSLPSKTFSIMAGARPLLSISPEDSELALMLAQFGCGENVPPGCPELLAAKIIEMKKSQDELVARGDRARHVLENFFSRQKVVEQNEELYRTVLANNPF